MCSQVPLKLTHTHLLWTDACMRASHADFSSVAEKICMRVPFPAFSKHLQLVAAIEAQLLSHLTALHLGCAPA